MATARGNESTITGDSIKFSLLTCDPGNEIYTLFGHTAILYQNFTQKTDVVFNYGLFSFETPNFIWRFVKGETDYALGITTYDRFKKEYQRYNRSVWKQELNLTTAQKETLLNLLQTNYLPQNRIYRYNFLFDNCSTRARDIIVKAINGEVEYTWPYHENTFRDIIYEHTVGYDWSRFGMDFCLGMDVDQPITANEEMFAPFSLMNEFAYANITTGNHSKPLVFHTSIPVDSHEDAQTESYLITPLRAFLLLFMVVTALTIYGIKKKKSLWWLDLLLFLAAGVAGCVIAFLTFFSEHPAVSPNFLIFVFHPIHLLALPFFIRKEIKGKRSIYHVLNAVILTLFILLWPIIPQHFNLAVLPLALSLLVRSGANLLIPNVPMC
nr:DUF4105 domain-containing protein [Bacteroides sp. 519]